MKTVHKLAMVAAIGAFNIRTVSGSAAHAGPIVSPEHYGMTCAQAALIVALRVMRHA
jgi:hypothetical protein